MKANFLEDEELPWHPFGLTLTYKEWNELVTWYVQEYYDHNLNTMEEKQCLEITLPRP